jgi:hypothetical protein
MARKATSRPDPPTRFPTHALAHNHAQCFRSIPRFDHKQEQEQEPDWQMNRDKEHLQLLAIFHYVVAGLATMLSFLPLLYSAVGGFLLYAAHHPESGNQEPPPAVLGWVLIALGALFFLVGVAMAICILIAGRSLSHCKRYSFALVVACIECLFVPFGTILGVFTIVALSRESVKGLFSKAPQTAG